MATIPPALQARGFTIGKALKVKDFSDGLSKTAFFAERNNIIETPDEQLGNVRMQGIVPKLPSYDLRVRHAGVARGNDNDDVFGRELGLTEAEITQLAADGVV